MPTYLGRNHEIGAFIPLTATVIIVVVAIGVRVIIGLFDVRGLMAPARSKSAKTTGDQSVCIGKIPSFSVIENLTWRTLNDSTGGDGHSMIPRIKYRYRFPHILQVSKVPGLYSVGVSNNGFSPEFYEGAFQAFAYPLYLKHAQPDLVGAVTATEACLGSRISERVSGTDPNNSKLKRIDYRLSNQQGGNVDKAWGFAFTCYYAPKAGVDLEAMCDHIASTLEFIENH